MKKIEVEPQVDSVFMPENLRVGLMISEQRKKCKNEDCDFEYYSFALGQSPFPVPKVLQEALCKNAGKGHYSSSIGIIELRKAVVDFNSRHFNLNVDLSRIVIGSGTKGLINTLFSILDVEVVIPTPSWIGYAPQLTLLKKKFHTLPLEEEHNYKINPKELEALLKKIKKQKLLVLNNPNNPTGALYKKEELEKIAEVCKNNNCLVLSDEIYALTTYNFEDFTSMGLIYPEGTFVTNGLSKDRSSGGYRLGTCILPEKCSQKIKDDFAKVAAIVYSNVSTPIQYAAIEAYKPNEEIEEYFEITRKIHEIIGKFLSKEFNKIGGLQATEPFGAFYFLADFNELKEDLYKHGIKNSNDLSKSLLESPFHIAVVTGDSIMAEPDNFLARIAFVDYDGEEAFKNYKRKPPKNEEEKLEFVKQNASRMFDALPILKNWVEHIKG